MKIQFIQKTFGRWTVIKELAQDSHYSRWFECKCSCGNIGIIRGDHLTHSKSQSCGCLRDELAKNRATRHGFAGTRIYRTWVHMKYRCENPKAKSWKYYGGRGIKVCARWQNSFEAFLKDVGHIPKGMTIERKNNDGNYTPENVRIASPIEQANNKSNSRRLTVEGVTKTSAEWSRETGISARKIRSRIDNLGWSPKRAMNNSTFSTR